MEIVSLNLTHTCTKDQENKRKRNYLTKDIKNLSTVMEAYVPAQGGNTKQVQAMTKVSTGVTLKTGQASTFVRGKIHDSIEAQIGQFMFLPSFFQCYEEDDPLGTYDYKFVPCQWNTELRQFERAYMAISMAKLFLEKCWHFHSFL
jgi:hypothetical protein